MGVDGRRRILAPDGEGDFKAILRRGLLPALVFWASWRAFFYY